jgi:hypothetical protein
VRGWWNTAFGGVTHHSCHSCGLLNFSDTLVDIYLVEVNLEKRWLGSPIACMLTTVYGDSEFTILTHAYFLLRDRLSSLFNKY